MNRPDTQCNLVAALFRLENSTTPREMQEVLQRLSERLADPQYSSLRRDFSLFACWKLRRKVNDRRIPEITDLWEIHQMLEERQSEWWKQWKEEGKREGILEGKREGILEGKREGIQLVLRQRFGTLPPWADQRLAQATEADLVRWAKEVLNPTLSLEELLET